MKFLIYKYTNKINGKSYIGQTRDSLYQRADGPTGKGYKSCPKFWAAIKAYGFDCFIPSILEEIETEDINLVNEREKYWIAYYNTFYEGYNVTTGGEARKEVSPETRIKLSQVMKDRYANGWIAPFTGHEHTEENRKILSEKTKQWWIDHPEKRAKDDRHIDKHIKDGAYRAIRSIANGTLIKGENPSTGEYHYFNSKAELARFLGFTSRNYSTISKRCEDHKIYHELILSYVEKENLDESDYQERVWQSFKI